ncbi:hypothetical protein M6D93_12455 [Jatrophihabitans telluris]|uniref:Uncharacterized protein n=1 Tax=Jatrophihabitans telluris TaxID=2038343 RepID=A0ABY4QVG0_9ACTN|nr:hypothetical protein [Jatrophihabitans telluris]UQX87112.1 hypothetical protein M6D93_12455 [Jatrophihabitans telluris]
MAPSLVGRVLGRWPSYDTSLVEGIALDYGLDTIYGAAWIGQGRAEELSGCSHRQLDVLVADELVEVRQAFNGYRRYRLADVSSVPSAVRLRVRRGGQLNAGRFGHKLAS